MEILKNISLEPYNTFGIDSKAKYFAKISSKEEIWDLLGTAEFACENRFILGSGSNVLFSRDFDGLVLKIDIKGLNLLEINPDGALLNVGAGENWSDFVTTCTDNKYYGIENLVLIPGTVGAAPVQNIGAYGVEQKDFFHSLEGIDLDTGENISFSNDDCQFAYRDSIFKSKLSNKLLITDVVYKLKRQWEPNLSYGELAKELDKFSFIMQDAKYVMNTVVRIRRHKLPDYKIEGNAGSFFKNPEISAEHFAKIRDNNMPHYILPNGMLKVPAAWLIEQCGWRGKKFGNCGVSDKHALIIVNYGNSSGAEIYKLSEEIIESVEAKFNIRLEREVRVV